VVNLIEQTHQLGEIEFRDKLLRTLFDLRTTEAVLDLTTRAPERFRDRAHLREWIAGETVGFDKNVERTRRRYSP
jgi:hypothetical protein